MTFSFDLTGGIFSTCCFQLSPLFNKPIYSSSVCCVNPINKRPQGWHISIKAGAADIMAGAFRMDNFQLVIFLCGFSKAFSLIKDAYKKLVGIEPSPQQKQVQENSCT